MSDDPTQIPPPPSQARLSATTTMKRSSDRTTLLSLPDEVLTHVLAHLAPKPAFQLALTNTRLLSIFRNTFTVLDLSTPFSTHTIPTPALTRLLRHAPNLTALKLSQPLSNPPPLRLSTLSVPDSPTCHSLFTPALRELHIAAPLLSTPNKLYPVIASLDTLSITYIDTECPLLDDIEHLLETKGHTLSNLTLSISEESIEGITDFIRVICTLQNLRQLKSFTCGTATPEAVSKYSDTTDFVATLRQIENLLEDRPAPCNRHTTQVLLHTMSFEADLVQAILPYTSDAQFKLSFAGNTLLLPTDGSVTITELATYPGISAIPASTKLTSYNISNRQLAISYTPSQKPALGRIVTPTMKTLRVNIPFRSEESLTPIAKNIEHVMQLSSNVQELHITREIVYFLQEGMIAPLLRQWKSLKRLYLTAPELYTQDPWPEHYSAKYSAWRFMVSLPKFLERLVGLSPNLEVLLLEKIGCMGDVEHPTAMTQLIEQSLRAVDQFEHVLSVDACTVRAQLLLWRRQFAWGS